MMGSIFQLLQMSIRKPRKQQLACSRKEMPQDVFAIIRLAWFKNGKQYSVEELQVLTVCPDTIYTVQKLVHEALKAGADVCVLTACDPTKLGFV